MILFACTLAVSPSQFTENSFTKSGYCNFVRFDLPFDHFSFFSLCSVCRSRLDLGIVVDGSGSVGRANFMRCLNFITNLVSSFSISPRYTRVGILLYSHRLIPIFPFNQYKRLRDVLWGIKKMKFPGGGTKTGLALSFARRYLFARSNNRKVLLLITDGKSYDGVSKPAAVLRNMGVEVFALGVGKRYSLQQLIQIASNRRHIFTVAFRNLGSFVRAVKEKACKGRKACPRYAARTFDINLTTGFHLVTIKHYILTRTINTICSTVNMNLITPCFIYVLVLGKLLLS